MKKFKPRGSSVEFEYNERLVYVTDLLTGHQVICISRKDIEGLFDRFKEDMKEEMLTKKEWSNPHLKQIEDRQRFSRIEKDSNY